MSYSHLFSVCNTLYTSLNNSKLHISHHWSSLGNEALVGAGWWPSWEQCLHLFCLALRLAVQDQIAPWEGQRLKPPSPPAAAVAYLAVDHLQPSFLERQPHRDKKHGDQCHWTDY